MNRWFILLAVAGGMIGCAEDGYTDDDSTETLQQAIDGAVITPTADAGAADDDDDTSSSADAGTTSSGTGIGAACTADTDCSSPAIRCVKNVSIPFGGIEINFSGGYCSLPCTTNDVCGAGAGCPLAMAATFLPDLSQCLKQCADNNECRDGYSCQALPSFGGFGGAAPAAPAAPAQKHCLPPLPAFPGIGN